MAAYTEGSVWLATRTGIASAPAQIDIKSTGTGLYAERSVFERPDGVQEFLGTDDFYIFNGAQVAKIAQSVRDQVFSELTTVALRSMFAQTLLDTQEYLFFIVAGGGTTTGYANKVWVHNWARDCWYPWTVAGMTCSVLHRIDNTKTIDQLIGTIDEQVYEIDSRFISQAFPVLITGNENGKIYQWGPQYAADAGVAISCRWTSRDFESDDIDPERKESNITIRSILVTYKDVGAPFTLDFSYSTNAGQSWVGPFSKTFPTSGGSGILEGFVNKQVTGKRIRFKVEQSSATQTFQIVEFSPVLEIRAEQTV